MFGIFCGSAKHLFRGHSSAVCIDNDIFRLHYKVTVIVLLSCSFAVMVRQYVGYPIDCTMDLVKSREIIEYCWMYSTFLNPGKSRIEAVVHPGVYGDEEEETNHSRYYQWVYFLLFLQSISFYFPRYLWKIWEAGRMKTLSRDLFPPTLGADEKRNNLASLTDYFRVNLHRHNWYAVRFMACEALNFLNVIVQVFLIDYLLGGEFTTYGWDVVKFTQMEPSERGDPMAAVFPKLTKCTFHKFGVSGTIQKYDGICVLPLNVVNERIYVVLWFWFVLLATVTEVGLLRRLVLMFSTRLRLCALRIRSPLSSEKDLRAIVDQFQLGDWFIFYQLSKNIDPLIYKDLTRSLSAKFDSKSVV